MTTGAFKADDFTATKFYDGADKAKFANLLVRFAAGGFERTKFTKFLYQRLSNSFGHIAHFNIDGFYHEWFASDDRRLQWLRYAANGGAYGSVGSPAHTFCDVELAVARWILESGLLKEYQVRVNQAQEMRERALLAELKAKYELPAMSKEIPAAPAAKADAA